MGPVLVGAFDTQEIYRILEMRSMLYRVYRRAERQVEEHWPYDPLDKIIMKTDA
jgi:hypothetical protein